MNAIIEKWRLDQRYYFCRHAEQRGRDDRRAFIAVVDDFGDLVEIAS